MFSFCIGPLPAGPPLPTPRQLEWMELETIQFINANV